MGSHNLTRSTTDKMGTSLLLQTLCLSLMGVSLGDQSALTHGYTQEEVTAPLGYPIEGQDTGLTAGGYYSQYPTTASGNYDYSLAYGATDRISDVISLPLVITAFFSAMVGGILAPLVTTMAARLGDVELPEMPDIRMPEMPDLPVKKTNSKKKNKVKGRQKE